MSRTQLALLILSPLTLASCHTDSGPFHPPSFQNDTDADADADADSDTDTDSDSDSDADADSDADTDCVSGAVSDHLGIAMASICPCTFTKGSPADEVGRDDNESEHRVTLTRGYLLGVYEVTKAQFEGFMGYQPSWVASGPNSPVDNMSWHEAAAFTNAVSIAAGVAPCFTCTGSGAAVDCDLDPAFDAPYDCPGYRLPTTAEWENAARAGTTSAFWSGGSLQPGDPEACDGDLGLDNGTILDDIAWYCGNADESAHSVGSLQANPWGLYDVHGNVREWCHGWLDPNDYAGDATNPWGREEGLYRSSRGGSWGDPPHEQRSAYRYGCVESYTHYLQGLRLARSE